MEARALMIVHQAYKLIIHGNPIKRQDEIILK